MTSEPLATKLAVLIRYLRDGRPLRGSGLRIGGRYILTADHCADGSDHRIIVAGSEFDATVSVRSGTRDVDIAVLIAPDLPSVEPLPCARVNATISATVEDCAGMGLDYRLPDVPFIVETFCMGDHGIVSGYHRAPSGHVYATFSSDTNTPAKDWGIDYCRFVLNA